jgi:GNAT superfamily N-acetyltransferase
MTLDGRNRAKIRYSEQDMKADLSVKLRPLTAEDLDGANAVIEAAIRTWQLPDRVKRLSLPGYRYDANDLEHLRLVGAVVEANAIVGVVSWEPASASDTPNGVRGLLLHGVYVVPTLHRTGIGSRLLNAAIEVARQGGFAGLLVKANRDAHGFFSAKGLQQLSVVDTGRDYPYRFWRDLRAD